MSSRVFAVFNVVSILILLHVLLPGGCVSIRDANLTDEGSTTLLLDPAATYILTLEFQEGYPTSVQIHLCACQVSFEDLTDPENHYAFGWQDGVGFSESGPDASGSHLVLTDCSYSQIGGRSFLKLGFRFAEEAIAGEWATKISIEDQSPETLFRFGVNSMVGLELESGNLTFIGLPDSITQAEENPVVLIITSNCPTSVALSSTGLEREDSSPVPAKIEVDDDEYQDESPEIGNNPIVLTGEIQTYLHDLTPGSQNLLWVSIKIPSPNPAGVLTGSIAFTANAQPVLPPSESNAPVITSLRAYSQSGGSLSPTDNVVVIQGNVDDESPISEVVVRLQIPGQSFQEKLAHMEGSQIRAVFDADISNVTRVEFVCTATDIYSNTNMTTATATVEDRNWDWDTEIDHSKRRLGLFLGYDQHSDPGEPLWVSSQPDNFMTTCFSSSLLTSVLIWYSEPYHVEVHAETLDKILKAMDETPTLEVWLSICLDMREQDEWNQYKSVLESDPDGDGIRIAQHPSLFAIGVNSEYSSWGTEEETQASILSFKSYVQDELSKWVFMHAFMAWNGESFGVRVSWLTNSTITLLHNNYPRYDSPPSSNLNVLRTMINRDYSPGMEGGSQGYFVSGGTITYRQGTPEEGDKWLAQDIIDTCNSIEGTSLDDGHIIFLAMQDPQDQQSEIDTANAQVSDQWLRQGDPIDTQPPQTSVSPLPSTVGTWFQVEWYGTDDISGIRWYDIQYRDGTSGAWTDWITQTTGTASTFIGQDGHTYYFRSRGIDNAGNTEAYPTGNGDTYTTVIAGNGTTPSEFIQDQIKTDGGYGMYGNDWSAHYWNCYGSATSALCGATQPDGIAERIRSGINPSDMESHLFDLQYASYQGIMTLSEIGETLPNIASQVDYASRPGDGTKGGLEWEYQRAFILQELGATPSDAASLASQIQGNQNTDGGWEHDPIWQGNSGLDGWTGDRSCVWRTHHAVLILTWWGYAIPNPGLVESYIRDAQNGDGGWGYEAGRASDLYPTLCAVETLQALGASIPSNVAGFVNSCQNHDGGFGDRPGWRSRLESTYYALKTLQILGVSDLNPKSPITTTPQRPEWFNDPSYTAHFTVMEVWSGNYAGYQNFPGIMAETAAKMNLHIVGAKCVDTDHPMTDWYNAYAQSRGLDTYCVNSPETYSFKLYFNGYQWTMHSMESAHIWGTSPAKAPYTSGSYVGTRFDQLAADPDQIAFLQHGIAWWNHGDGKVSHQAMDVWDASVEMGVYNTVHVQGILGGNVAIHQPWVEKVLDHLSPIVESDSHGEGFTDGFWQAGDGQTMFISQGSGWEDFYNACYDRRVVYITRDGQIWGPPDAVDWVNLHGIEISGAPEIAVSAITTPSVDCWDFYSWEGSFQGGAVFRICCRTEIYECKVDGTPQDLGYASAAQCAGETGAPAKYHTDYWYAVRPDLQPGPHTIEVRYRRYDGGEAVELVEFEVNTEPQPIKIVCYGDSITEVDTTYEYVVLMQENHPDWVVIDEADGGWTSVDVANHVETTAAIQVPDIATIMVGVNDCQHLPWRMDWDNPDFPEEYSKDNYEARISRMVAALKAANPDVRIILMSESPMTHHYVGKPPTEMLEPGLGYPLNHHMAHQRGYDDVMENYAATHEGVEFCNVRDPMLDDWWIFANQHGWDEDDTPFNEEINTYMMIDGLHPNAHGHQIIYQELVKTIEGE